MQNVRAENETVRNFALMLRQRQRNNNTLKKKMILSDNEFGDENIEAIATAFFE
jgi:hypothetical protein